MKMLAKAKKNFRRIYFSAGSSNIFRLMDQYFTDLFTCSTIITWRWLRLLST
ncbi:hypothetical protein EDB80DRAFT_699069 [Ilyonectria destructans]|nr:hypothetical protein EDB80DRAFT_699069 [Ilyonectria destructans]